MKEKHPCNQPGGGGGTGHHRHNSARNSLFTADNDRRPVLLFWRK